MNNEDTVINSERPPNSQKRNDDGFKIGFGGIQNDQL
jgi:hypothetical protein